MISFGLGLMSWQAIFEYPDVFGRSACLSMHWPGDNLELEGPFSDMFFSDINANMPDPKSHKLYFDFGTKSLDQYYLKFEGANHMKASPITLLMSK